MRTAFFSRVLALTLPLLASLGGHAGAQEVTLSEPFKPGHTSKVEINVKVTGKLALPSAEKDKPGQLVTIAGTSKLAYEERLLEPDDASLLKTVRAYRTVEFERTVGEAKQDAGIRPSVRRMVVIKSGERKAPFSPDGPMTWGEIDVVRTDVFNPALIPGLLPNGPVKPEQFLESRRSGHRRTHRHGEGRRGRADGRIRGHREAQR